MHESHRVWMLNVLRHYHGVLRVRWQILSWSLLSLDISFDRLIRLKSFPPMTSGSVARGNLCYCTDVVVAVIVVVALNVAVLKVALVNLDAVEVLVADAAGLDHIA